MIFTASQWMGDTIAVTQAKRFVWKTGKGLNVKTVKRTSSNRIVPDIVWVKVTSHVMKEVKRGVQNTTTRVVSVMFTVTQMSPPTHVTLQLGRKYVPRIELGQTVGIAGHNWDAM